MTNQEKLKKIAMDGSSTEALLQSAAAFCADYLKTMQTREPFPTAEAIRRAQEAFSAFPEQPTPAREVLQQLAEIYGPATVNSHSGRYFGYVHGSSFPIGFAAKWLSTVWDQNTPLYLLSPATSILETQVENWLVDALDFHPDTAVGFVSSTSQSLLTGVTVARDTLLDRLGWDTRKKGLRDAPKIRVVLSDQAHVAVYRALHMAGIGENDVEIVPTDEQGRMRADRAPDLDDHTLLFLQAGNLYTGAFDPYADIIPAARKAGAWTHVDGAFGLWAAASPEKRPLAEMLREADSWSADCHKTLNTPFSCGLILCRHRARLVQSLSKNTAYLEFSQTRDGMNYSPDMARRCAVAEIWATLKCLGREGLTALVDSLCDSAKAISRGLAKEGYEVVNDVVFNQISVRLDTDEATEAAMKRLQDDAVVWCAGGAWLGRKVIRISVSSWRTDADDIAKTVQAFRDARGA